MRPIDADALLKFVEDRYEFDKDIPVPVKCSECKHAEVDPIFHDYWCNGNKVATDHYCGYAERRE